jgi:ATP-dependent exoDNAse (exonuclease V) alpha subunit
LYDSESPVAVKMQDEYRKAIKGQIEVCQKILNKPICVICGEAGTGKTTVIKAIISAIERTNGSGTSFKLLAPTGKATDRIREKTGKNASTIHSFLANNGWLNDNFTFKRIGAKVEEGYRTYIIDESSMLNLEIMASLFRSINWATVQRLIFVGDPNQLPPIGRGRLFADIIDWLSIQSPDSIARLETNIRQMENQITGHGTGIIELGSIYASKRRPPFGFMVHQ